MIDTIPRAPSAILFDLDDTILCFDAGAAGCWRAICTRFASRLSRGDAAELLSAIEATRQWFWGDPERHRRGRLDLEAARREIVTTSLLRLGVDDPLLAAEIAGEYATEREATIQPFPGAVDTLVHFRERGVKLALLTNGHGVDQRRKLRSHSLEDLFDCILIEEEFGAGKPDERIYLHALNQLVITAPDGWMVGDHLEWDIAAAQRLGLTGIWVDATGRGLPASSPVTPGRIIGALPELLYAGI